MPELPFIKSPNGLVTITVSLPPLMLQKLNERAKAEHYPAATYASNLLLAAWSARVKPDGQDPALERAVGPAMSQNAKLLAQLSLAQGQVADRDLVIARQATKIAGLEASPDKATIEGLRTQVATFARDLQEARKPKAAEPPKGVFVTIEEHRRRLAERDTQIDAGLAREEKLRRDVEDALREQRAIAETRDRAMRQAESLQAIAAHAGELRGEIGGVGDKIAQAAERWRVAYERTRRRLDKVARAPAISGAPLLCADLSLPKPTPIVVLKPQAEADALPGSAVRAIKAMRRVMNAADLARAYGVSLEAIRIVQGSSL